MTEPHVTQERSALDELVALSRRSLHGEATHRGERTFERVQQRLRARREQSRARALRPAWPRVALWGLPVAGAACALGLYLWLGIPAPLGYDVSGALSMVSGEIVGGEQSSLCFTDGSELVLSHGARARVVSLDARGGQIALIRGQAHLSVAKRPRSRWLVQAGPFRVRVTGTAFDVRWSQAEQTFELVMHRGEVYLTGPLLQGEVRARGGQAVRVALASQRVWIGDAKMARARPTTPAPDPPRQAAADVASNDGASGAATKEPAGPVAVKRSVRVQPRDGERLSREGKGPWARRLARGDFNGVLAEAERFGIARALSTAPLHELLALADAARFLRRDDLARRSLLSARKRFPRSEMAGDAAFLLGRLEERGGGNQAVFWYERYLQENPRGPYAEQALGRHMLHVYRTEGHTAARSLARDYLEHHATGAYAEAARRLVSGGEVPASR